MVATALIILSTLGFDMVDPMNMEFIVDDFLSTKSSSSLLVTIIENFKKYNYNL
jgi:hypothetical protein